MYMDEGMDTGDMIYKEEVEILEDETTGELWDKLSEVGGELLVKTLKSIEEGKAPREKQSDDFSIAPMLDKKMAQIDWKNQTAEQIKNLVRGLNPIMGAYTHLNNKKIKFWKVDIINNQEDLSQKPNGTIIKADQKEGLFIKTKKGILKVIEIQGENAKRMSIQDYLRGNNLNINEVFE